MLAFPQPLNDAAAGANPGPHVAPGEPTLTLPWPEMPATSRAGETVRQMLDYLCWIARELQTLGAHGGGDLGPWRRNVGAAYEALVNPMVAGYGDPYPPDVPPARNPGIWPDVAAADLAGMTVRHQLVVIGLLAEQSRSGVGLRARPELLADLERRIARARTALDHGPQRPMPAEAQTQPSAALLAAAQAEERAIRDHARRRTRQVRKMLGRTSAPPGEARRPLNRGPAQQPPPVPAGGRAQPGGGRIGSSKPGSLKSGPPKAGMPKPGQPKPGLPKPGLPKPGLPKPGQPKPGQPKPGLPQPGSPKLGPPKPALPKPGSPKAGAQQPGSRKPDSPKSGAGRPGSMSSGAPADRRGARASKPAARTTRPPRPQRRG